MHLERKLVLRLRTLWERLYRCYTIKASLKKCSFCQLKRTGAFTLKWIQAASQHSAVRLTEQMRLINKHFHAEVFS